MDRCRGRDPERRRQGDDVDATDDPLEPDHWWIQRPEHNGIIQRDGDGPAQQIPAGLRLVAEVDGGFLASDGDAYALWDRWKVRPLPFRGWFLDATPRVIALSNDCPGSSCVIEIHDLKRGTSVRLASDGGDWGALSPDGNRLAVTSALSSYMTIFDTKLGRSTIAIPRRRSSPTVTPFTWASNRELLVLTPTGIAVVDGDSVPNRTIDDGGAVQQIIALP